MNCHPKLLSAFFLNLFPICKLLDVYKGKQKNSELHDLHPLADLVRINQHQRRFGLQDLCRVADLVTVRLLTILRAPSAD